MPRKMLLMMLAALPIHTASHASTLPCVRASRDRSIRRSIRQRRTKQSKTTKRAIGGAPRSCPRRSRRTVGGTTPAFCAPSRGASKDEGVLRLEDQEIVAGQFGELLATSQFLACALTKGGTFLVCHDSGGGNQGGL